MRHSWSDILWFTLAYPVSLVVAVAIGYGVAEVYYRRRRRLWKPSGMENALITLFGLLLSFTLLAANNAQKERTALIHQAADALAELHRESQLLPAPNEVAVRTFLRQFLALELAEHGPRRPHDPAHTSHLERLTSRFWQQQNRPEQLQVARQLLPAWNKLTATTSRLHYADQERTPTSIMGLLLISSWAIGILVGFSNSAQETRHYFVPALFIIISVLTVQAIRDLDNPDLGLMRPSYRNLQDVQRLLAPQDPPPSR